MKKISPKRFVLSKQRIIFILILLIAFNTTFFLFYFTNSLGNVLLTAAEKELKEVTTMLVVSNINREDLSQVAINDVIIVNKNNADEITDIDFKLDVAYDMFFDLKIKLDKAVLALKAGRLPNNTILIKDNLVLKIPFYAYTNNPLLMNLGPKILLGINILEQARGSVSTDVSNYGINTVLINVYMNLYITQSVLLPTHREEIYTEFNILLASKVVQGKVPSLYTGKYETNSGLINIE